MSEFYVVSFASLNDDSIKDSKVIVIGIYDNIEDATKAKNEAYEYLKFAADLYECFYFDSGTLQIEKCKLNFTNNYIDECGIEKEYKEFLNKQYKNE